MIRRFLLLLLLHHHHPVVSFLSTTDLPPPPRRSFARHATLFALQLDAAQAPLSHVCGPVLGLLMNQRRPNQLCRLDTGRGGKIAKSDRVPEPLLFLPALCVCAPTSLPTLSRNSNPLSTTNPCVHARFNIKPPASKRAKTKTRGFKREERNATSHPRK